MYIYYLFFKHLMIKHYKFVKLSYKHILSMLELTSNHPKTQNFFYQANEV